MFLKRLTAGLLAGMVALAAQAGDAKTGLEAAANAAPDDVICTHETPMGSHIKRRVCATRAQRDEQTKLDQEALRSAQGRGKKGYASNKDPQL
jgi:hypothetical protein